MPYPPHHREETRLRIVRSARKLFNHHGFDGVSIDDVMADAGLTRGGFYSYFRTKAELYAEAVALALAEPPSDRWRGISVDFGAVDASRQVVRGYLSREHFVDIDGSCPLVALPSDVSRGDATVKRAYQAVLEAMVGLFEEGLAREGARDRARALAIAAMCVGGLVLARSVEDRRLADELRHAAEGTALGLGGWSSAGGEPGRRMGGKGGTRRKIGRR
jgi:TetR/AcrR family transcriptional regulator, transcriptional repressor for nem operon